ncbi:protein YAE1 homolog [Pelodytes ibericus]
MEGEDVFDEEADEMNLLQKDWKKSMENRLKEGYRDGVDAGKENSMQTGFNLGYKFGVNLLMPYGELRGTLSALLTWCQLHNLEPAVSTKLNDLLTAVCQYEDHLLKCLSSIYQIPHPTDLSTCLEEMGFGGSGHEDESKEPSSCASGRNCCKIQDSLPTSLASCRTTQQLNDRAKHELGRIAKETFSVVEQFNLPEGLLCHLQTLKI